MASVTSTYARAFADAVIALKLDPVRTLHEAQSLAQLVHDSRDLREVWNTPSVPAAHKLNLLDAIIKREGFSVPVRNFVAVLIDHHRIAFFSAIVQQFEREMDERTGVVEAEVSTFRELGESERKTLESDVVKLTGKKVRARYVQDASLLGGAIIRVGSTIYDGSIRGQLQEMKAVLTA
jgi:F-type H+-transporting ATPase subunit delta